MPRGGALPGEEVGDSHPADLASINFFRDVASGGSIPVHPRSSGTVALLLLAPTVKIIILTIASAAKLFFALVLSKFSLALSVLIALGRMYDRARINFRDVDVLDPGQYPEKEPDLSGYGYEGLKSRAVNKTRHQGPPPTRPEGDIHGARVII